MRTPPLMDRGRRPPALRAPETRRRRAVENHAPAVWMIEPEARRVQAHAPQRVVPAPVLAIADDRMAERGELRPDLPAAAGLKLDLDERRVAVALQHAVVA